jgi:hypothetical protein
MSPATNVAAASILTIEAALAREFGPEPRSAERSPAYGPPRWSPDFLGAAKGTPSQAATLDRLLSGMAGAGHGLEALSFYLGLSEDEVRDRLTRLGLPPAPDKRLRRPSSSNPWSLDDVRRLIALWLDNVAVASIAATFGRSPSSIHGKRRWLGLGVRGRKGVAQRTIEDCRRTGLPWKPSFDVSAILARLMAPRLGTGAKAESAPQFPTEVKWRLGRDEEMDRRFSILGFAGLRSAAIAERMRIEFGVQLTEKAVDNRISRLQIVRRRGDLIDDYDAETVDRLASEAMSELGATLRQCAALKRSFWWCRTIGGNRSTCREFDSKKFQSRKAERSCSEIMGMV